MENESPEPPDSKGKSGKVWRRIGCALGILMLVMAFAVINTVVRTVFAKAKKTNAVGEVYNLMTALMQFKNDYGHFPRPEGIEREDYELQTNGWLMDTLEGGNPRGTVYFESNEKFVIGEGDERMYTDPWGRPYRIVIDGNGDGKVRRPDDPNLWIEAPVAVFSLGEDGVLDKRSPSSW